MRSTATMGLAAAGAPPGQPTALAGPHAKLALLLAAIGAMLRLWQYLANPSLWIDEIALARNIVERSTAELLTPLDYAQVSPAGFLLIEKLFVQLFGSGDLALRLFPLIASLASVALAYDLASRLLRPAERLFAIGLVAAAPALILHGPEVKQYASDVAAVLLIAVIAVRALERPPSRRFALLSGGAGAVCAFLSFPAMIGLAGAGAALVGLSLAARRSIRPYVPMVAIWAVAGLAAAWLAFELVLPETRAYQRLCWPPGFFDGPGGPVRAVKRIWVALSSVFGESHNPLDDPYTLLALFGFVTLGRFGALLAAPVVVALALAAVKIYPFEGRLVLPLLPLYLIAAASGAGWIARKARRAARIPEVITLASAALPALLGILFHQPPYRREETRPLLSWVASRHEEADAMYVYYGAWQAMRFYGPRHGFEPGEYEVGGCHRSEPREYLREVDRLRGRNRAWTIFAHEPRGLYEREAITGYLDRIGTRLDERYIPGSGQPGVAAYLYDLGDAARAANATPDSYVMPVPAITDSFEIALGCAGGPQVP